MFPDVKIMHEIDLTTFTNQLKESSKMTEYCVLNFYLQNTTGIRYCPIFHRKKKKCNFFY